MKKLLLFLALFTSLSLPAQNGIRTFFSGINEGVTYTLPKTQIEVKIKAACITQTPGEFNRYAERYLRIDNAVKEVSCHWEITDVTITTKGKSNPEKTFTFKLSNNIPCNIYLCKDGIINGINTKSEEVHPQEDCRITPTHKFGIDASQYMTEEMVQATSTAKLAELTAKEIYATRESKLDITRGMADIIPQDGLSMQLILDELSKQEKALTELFTGRTDTTYHCQTYVIEPKINCDTTKAVLFRFSRKLGFVDKEDLAGEPVYYNMNNLKTVYIPMLEVAEEDKIEKREGIHYNIPGKANFSLYTRSKKLYSSELSIAQFGVTEILSKEIFNRKMVTKILFDTATGGIISIENNNK